MHHTRVPLSYDIDKPCFKLHNCAGQLRTTEYDITVIVLMSASPKVAGVVVVVRSVAQGLTS